LAEHVATANVCTCIAVALASLHNDWAYSCHKQHSYSQPTSESCASETAWRQCSGRQNSGKDYWSYLLVH